MSSVNRLATKKPYWWRTHHPLTVKFWLTLEVELTLNLQPGPPGNTKNPRPASWLPWLCFPIMATPPSYACRPQDDGTRSDNSCPPWTSTTTTCRWSLKPPLSPRCPARAGLTQTWAYGASAVWINTMVCPQPFHFWGGAQRFETLFVTWNRPSVMNIYSDTSQRSFWKLSDLGSK